jgi:hypothetical protein
MCVKLPHGPGRPDTQEQLNIEFTPLNGFFDGLLGEPVKPFIVEGLLGSDNRLKKEIKLVLAGFAELPVADMKIGPVRDGLLDCAFTNIANKGFHGKLLEIR